MEPKICPFCQSEDSAPVHDFLKGWITLCKACRRLHEDEISAKGPKVGTFNRFMFPIIKKVYPHISL